MAEFEQKCFHLHMEKLRKQQLKLPWSKKSDICHGKNVYFALFEDYSMIWKWFCHDPYSNFGMILKLNLPWFYKETWRLAWQQVFTICHGNRFNKNCRGEKWNKARFAMAKKKDNVEDIMKVVVIYHLKSCRFAI